MIAIGLNLILGVLLFCALILGLRLERKLRGLRDSHADFAKAVSELDQAAGRTEHSLTALRAGTETAKNEVASRIDQARIACQRLEKLVADADKAADRLAAQPLPLIDRAPPPARPVQAPPPAPPRSAIARPEPEFARQALPARAEPASPRSRAKLLDDDLFAAPFPAPVARKAEPDPFIAPREPARPVPPQPIPLRADNDPVVGAVRSDRAAREAFFREMLEREPGPEERDPFAEGRFAHERRAMLAAIGGGRR